MSDPLFLNRLNDDLVVAAYHGDGRTPANEMSRQTINAFFLATPSWLVFVRFFARSLSQANLRKYATETERIAAEVDTVATASRMEAVTFDFNFG